MRDGLYESGAIEKGRGYGGTVILAEEPQEKIHEEPLVEVAILAPVVVEEAPAPPQERDLYAPVMKQLDSHWAKQRELDQWHCEMTALQGRRDTGGSWSRPDLVLVGYRKYEFLPERVFELMSFEVKPSYDVSIEGVMEALAHREAATRSFVLYHTDGQEFNSFPEYTRIQDLASKHGVGVIAAREADNFDQWAEIVPAQRATPDPESMDTFIKRTLSDGGKSKMRRWF